MTEEQRANKLLEHCTRLFEAMTPDAVEEEGVIVWRGRLLELAESLGISRGNYSRAITKLRDMGCVEQISRGFRGSKLSEYALIQPPTSDSFVKSAESDLTSRPTFDSLVARVKELERQIGGLNIVDALATHEAQLQELQRQVSTQTALTKGEQ